MHFIMKRLKFSFVVSLVGVSVAASAFAYNDGSNGVVSQRCAVVDNPYGIHTHIQERDWKSREFECEFIAKMGLGHTRTDLYWRMAQTKRSDPWDFSRIKACFDAAERHGIGLEPILYSPPQYAKPIWKYPDEFAEYMRQAFAAIGKDRFDIVEIGNEQNVGIFWDGKPDAKQYVDHLKVAYETVKSINPNVRVALGGLAGADASHDYLREVYEAGGAKYFDVMNIHPYCGFNPPEGNLDCQLERMKALMAEFGDAEKPWIVSETGYATHKVGRLALDLFLSGLKAADPKKQKWHLVVAACESEVARLDDGFPNMLKANLPKGSEAEHLSPRRVIERLKRPGVDAVVFPFSESYPADTVDAVADFVKKGGMLIDLGGMPMWVPCRTTDPRGIIMQMDNNVSTEDDRRKLRIGVVAHWMTNNLPSHVACHATKAGLDAGIRLPEGWITGEYFVTDEHLRPGDEFVPLVSCTNKVGAEVAAMALVKFNSDRKGKLLLSGLRHQAATIYQPVTEELQAMYLLKTIAICFAEGASRFFWYDLHAREINSSYSEHNFGICHKDYSPKPAMNAYKTFVARRPAGSVQLDGKWHNNARTCYWPQWRKPDGTIAGMLWKTGPSAAVPLRFDTDDVRFFDMEGNEFEATKTTEGYKVKVGLLPIFFDGGKLIVDHSS